MTPQRTLGVIGTLVWDRIFDRGGHAGVVEEWGGIAYGLAALRATLPDGWSILPIVKVGRDLSEEAYRFLREIPGVDPSAIVVVPEPNNRVELRYTSADRRTECLTGGVPPWTWPELAPVADLCDAMYVNFISGHELTLGVGRAFRTGYDGPTYADLHSLFLGINAAGVRVPRALDGWADWLRCFDAVQMNEDEFALMGQMGGDPWQLAAAALGSDLRLLTVTLGARGAAYIVDGAFEANPATWRRRTQVALPGSARSGRVPLDGPVVEGDPTGCGDVWGASFFARLLGGDDLEGATRTANRLASRNVLHRGARGLFRHLVGQISHIEK